MEKVGLPRGCSVIRYSFAEALASRLFLPGQANSERLKREHQSREEKIRGAYELIIRNAIQGGNDPDLSNIDEETGFTYRILLSQGISLLGSGHFILTTSQRMGMDATDKKAAFAVGGKMYFRSVMNLRQETRQAEGEIIGVVLNTGQEAARAKEGQVITIRVDQVYSLFNSVINARKELLREEAQGSLNHLFTQEEFDVATNWVLFGDF